ncbi:MAG: ATP synthase F1 subunit epsilon [Alphaproteobacteria bacterium CG_4_9_14_3_um_filter_47_13]|nr:MAG: ATP synthase F1 subunit epsilon [Alphaproteobacteria bacterium CG_4_9_14_3_um_filter_47_13]
MNEAQTFNFELVSPEEKLISEPATMVVIPGEEGDFGVLPNHSAIISSIRPGVIEIFTNNNEAPQRVFVAGGFADVSEKNCTVLAEEAINLKDLNQDTLEKSLRDLNEDLAMASEQADKTRVLHKITLTKAKLSAISGHLIA